MVQSTLLGFPRIGKSRELKDALEKFWKGAASEQDLMGAAATLRERHWRQQADAGIDCVPANDFSLYDHMLDMAVLFGVVPPRYRRQGTDIGLDTYFAMARGRQAQGVDVHAAEMTKWFDTNYHYIVPEFTRDQAFALSNGKVFAEFGEAKALGLRARPVLVGPLSFLLLGKRGDGRSPLDLLDALLPIYVDVLRMLEAAGAEWIQFDEPCLALDLDDVARAAYMRAYRFIRERTKLKLFVATYFGPLNGNLKQAIALPIDALHLDLVRGANQLTDALTLAPSSLSLSLGIVSGRNVWRNDLRRSLSVLEQAADRLGRERLWVAPSCSLLHVPYDLTMETALAPDVKSWMAFAAQKMREVTLLAKGLNEGRDSIRSELEDSDAAAEHRRNAAQIHDPDVAARLLRQPLNGAGRSSPYGRRRVAQSKLLNLPLYPTTTIGSFPQTGAIRKARSDMKQGKMTTDAYVSFMRERIAEAVAVQEGIGLDVLVHGEAERNDMVEYFGERLSGFAFTRNGWVQSYGSRCVKPPIIYGDVSRPQPMTVNEAAYAQSLTQRPVKGMLTGPVTILQWSFVRDDQPRATTAHQIALALQDEVLDLEKAGLRIIQIDEPAFREGLPLHRADWKAYLTWASAAFRLASTGTRDATQIHTHMCYSEFNDIIDGIRELDADVISIETSRSRMELLEAFVSTRYSNGIGPGVYDIHSPRVPSMDEIVQLLVKASERLPADQIWVNPDCGLKTRDWPETKAALAAMVAAAKIMRNRMACDLSEAG